MQNGCREVPGRQGGRGQGDGGEAGAGVVEGRQGSRDPRVTAGAG